jgi:outer membrane translocation and assembly module TamA
MFRLRMVLLMLINCMLVSAQVHEHQYSIRNATNSSFLLKVTHDSLRWVARINELNESAQQRGFLLAGIDSITKEGYVQTAWFTQNQKFYWARINVTPQVQAYITNAGLNFSTFQNKAVKAGLFSQFQQKLIRYYNENGYPDARSQLTSIAIHNDSISAKLEFSSGLYYTFRDIRLQGNSGADPKQIARYCGIRNGKPFSASTANQIDRNLKSVNYITVSSPTEIYRTDSGIIAYLFLAKRPANQFSGIVGIATNSNRKVTLTGELNLNLVNVLNHEEEMSLNWQKLQAYTQELGINTMWPFIKGSAWGIDAAFALYKHDTTYLTISTQAALRYQPGGSACTRFYIENYQSNILLQQNDNDSIGNYSRWLYGVEYADKLFDNPYNPQKGYRYNINLATGRQQYKPLNTDDNQTTQTINCHRAVFNGELFIPLGGNFTVRLHNYSGYLSGKNKVQNELFRIGGINNLRGIEENSLRVSSFAVQTTELRLIFDTYSALFVFYDQAWYQQRLKTGYYADTPMGLGVGMRFQTKSGIFSIQYAVGQQKGNSLSLQQAKIHIGYISRF